MSSTRMPTDSVTEFQKWFSNTSPADPQKLQIIIQAELNSAAASSPFNMLLEMEKGRVLKIWKLIAGQDTR